MKPMAYRFPEIKSKKSVSDQVLKIGEELDEVYRVFAEGRDRTIEETVDVMQACETLLRKLGCGSEELEATIEKVIQKNEARGYYEDHEDMTLMLKPCPFCGEQPDTVEEFHIEETTYVQIQCTNIHCPVETTLMLSKDEAYKVWNTRNI